VTMSKVPDTLKEGRQQENHLQEPDEVRKKTNIKTIQSQQAIRTVHHRVSHLVRQMKYLLYNIACRIMYAITGNRLQVFKLLAPTAIYI
jgi:hypothetical protein